MKVTMVLIFIISLFCSSSYASEKYHLYPKEGAFLSYYKKSAAFENETTTYRYIYEISIGQKNKSCLIAAIPEEHIGSGNAFYYNCEILKAHDELLVISKEPVKNDPYLESYYIYPKLKMGFMVVGKANHGFTKSLPAFPDASIAVIPLIIGSK